MISNIDEANKKYTLGTKFKLFLKWAGVVVFGGLSVACSLAALAIFAAYFIAPLAALFPFLAPVFASFIYTSLVSFATIVPFVIFAFITYKIYELEIKEEDKKENSLKEEKEEKKEEIENGENKVEKEEIDENNFLDTSFTFGDNNRSILFAKDLSNNSVNDARSERGDLITKENGLVGNLTNYFKYSEMPNKDSSHININEIEIKTEDNNNIINKNEIKTNEEINNNETNKNINENNKHREAKFCIGTGGMARGRKYQKVCVPENVEEKLKNIEEVDNSRKEKENDFHDEINNQNIAFTPKKRIKSIQRVLLKIKRKKPINNPPKMNTDQAKKDKE